MDAVSSARARHAVAGRLWRWRRRHPDHQRRHARHAFNRRVRPARRHARQHHGERAGWVSADRRPDHHAGQPRGRHLHRDGGPGADRFDVLPTLAGRADCDGGAQHRADHRRELRRARGHAAVTGPGGGRLRGTHLPHRACQRPAAVRGGARWPGAHRAGRQRAWHVLPRHFQPHHHRRRARPVLDGVRPRLRHQRALLRLLHRPERGDHRGALHRLDQQPRCGEHHRHGAAVDSAPGRE